MKSRVATSLTFQSEATIDCEPAWLKAAASVTSAAPGTCSPSAGLAPGEDREGVRRQRQPGDLPDGQPLARLIVARQEEIGAIRLLRVEHAVGGEVELRELRRQLEEPRASSPPAPSSAVTAGRTRASSRTSRLAAGSVPSGFARARSGESGAAPEGAQEVDQLELRHVAHPVRLGEEAMGAVRLLPGERVDRQVEEEVVREEDQVLVGAELGRDGAQEVARRASR